MRYAAILLLVCTPALAADLTIEERLSQLESQVKELRAENQLLREQFGLQAVQRQNDVKPAGRDSRLSVGGLLQAQAETGGRTDSRFTDDNDRFFLRRARINVQGRFVEDFDFRTELEVTGSLAGATGLRGQLTDAYVTWTRYPWLSVRAGQFKTPYGFEQLYLDSRLFTPERTFGNDRLTAGRQIGLAAIGTIGEAGLLTYSAGLFNGTGTNSSLNDDDRFMYVGRVAGTLYEGRIRNLETRVTAGVNGLTSHDRSVAMPPDFNFDSTPSSPARDGIFSGRRKGTGADAQVVLGRLEMWSEYLRGSFSPDNRFPAPTVNATSNSLLGAFMIVYDKLQLVGRYDRFLTTKTWTAGANYYIRGHDLKLQLHLVRGKRLGISHDRVIARLQTVF
ncbi:MAG: porin [Thermoanaerobaculia bacterium]